MRFDVTTRASPDQVKQALTDFTDRRLEIWSRTLDPKTYSLLAHGDTWAVARESTAGSPFWVVLRYDWADPTVVRWTVEDCSWGGSGDGSVRATPAEGGGSTLHAEWTYTGATRMRDRLTLPLLGHFPFRSIIAKGWVQALDRHAQSEPA